MGTTCCIANLQRNSTLVLHQQQKDDKPHFVQIASITHDRFQQPVKQFTLTQYTHRLADLEDGFEGFEEQFCNSFPKTATFNSQFQQSNLQQLSNSLSLFNPNTHQQNQGPEVSDGPSPTFNKESLSQDSRQVNLPIMKPSIFKTKTPEPRPNGPSTDQSANTKLNRSQSSNVIRQQQLKDGSHKSVKPDTAKPESVQPDSEVQSQVSQVKSILKNKKSKQPQHQKLGRTHSMYDDHRKVSDTCSQGTTKSKKKVQFDPKVLRPKNKNFYQ